VTEIREDLIGYDAGARDRIIELEALVLVLYEIAESNVSTKSRRAALAALRTEDTEGGKK